MQRFRTSSSLATRSRQTEPLRCARGNQDLGVMRLRHFMAKVLAGSRIAPVIAWLARARAFVEWGAAPARPVKRNGTIATYLTVGLPTSSAKHRLNREIMAPEVRLNGVENEPLGIVSINDALRMAGDLDVDLVEIAATGRSAGLPADGLRQVQVPGARRRRRRQGQTEGHRDQGGQVPARNRRRRLTRSRCATCAASSARTATRAR